MSKRENMYLFSLNQQDWTKRSDSENHLNMWTLNVMKATVIKSPDTIYRFCAITPARTAAANLVSNSACERNAAVWDSFISRVTMTWQQVTGVLQEYLANRRHICQTLQCDLWKTISFSDPEPAEWWSPVYVCQDCTLQRSLPPVTDTTAPVPAWCWFVYQKVLTCWFFSKRTTHIRVSCDCFVSY